MTNPWEQAGCETCGDTTYLIGDLCDDCHQVESRLDAYLNSYKGLMKILDAIQEKDRAVQALGPLFIDTLVRKINAQS